MGLFKRLTTNVAEELGSSSSNENISTSVVDVERDTEEDAGEGRAVRGIESGEGFAGCLREAVTRRRFTGGSSDLNLTVLERSAIYMTVLM